MTQYFFRTLWVPAVLIALLAITVFSLIQAAKAGTTSLIFNNVEQGPNSHSNPSIVVDGNGKLVKKTEDGKTLQQFTPEVAPAAQTSAVVAEAIVPSKPSDRSWFKMGLAYHVLNVSEFKQVGGTLSLTLMPLRGLGLTALAGLGSKRENFYGGELEVLPLRLSLFDFEDFLEAGGIVGGTSLGVHSQIKGTLHAGPKVQLNFGPHYSFTASYRTNLSDRNVYSYAMTDLGLNIRF
jgi:hypothetical protein